MMTPAPGGGSAMPATGDFAVDRNFALLVWGLYAASLIVPPACIAGLIVAYIKRSDAKSTVAASHYSRAIRLFWRSLIAVILGFFISQAALLMLIGGSTGPGIGSGFGGVALIVLWFGAIAIRFLVVSIKGLIKAANSEPFA